MSLKWARKLDVYRKVPKDLSEGSNIGGIVSIFTVALILFLIVKQTAMFISPPLKTRLRYGDPVTREEMKYIFGYNRINLDIEFPRFPCGLIALDLLDELYSHHPNIGSVKKLRINNNSQTIDYNNYQTFNQPNAEKQFQNIQKALAQGEGCRVFGSFTVKAVPGNFHLSSHGYEGLFLRTNVVLGKSMDTSHIIHELFFGQKQSVDYVSKNILNSNLKRLNGRKQKNTQLVSNMKGFNHNYHLDLIPTVYENTFLGQVKTYQYTYSHSSTIVQGMPGVYFNYHIGGMVVDFYHSRFTLLQFLISLCAIIGGAYTICTILYNVTNKIFVNNQGYELIH